MKAGFIGTGAFAREHAQVLRELDIDIVACHGTNREKTAAFARDFHCKIYADPATFISRNNIDVLYIVIPPFAHDGKAELMAIERNVPFLCEKPVGLDLTVCENILQKLKNKDLITSSGYLLRYEPLIERVKGIIERNIISTVRICNYSYMPDVHWWRKTALSGGMMIESGSHYIDLFRYLFGEIEAVCAFTTDGIAKNNIPNCDVYDSMEAIIQFESGRIGSIGITHLLNRIDARTDMLEVYGKNFALKIDLYQLRYKNEATALYKELDDTDWKITSNLSSKKNLLLRESIAFLSAIQKNNPSLIQSSYADAVQSLKIAFAMNQSAELKQIYTIKPHLDQVDEPIILNMPA
jgi:predicted dehydrogenase